MKSYIEVVDVTGDEPVFTGLSEEYRTWPEAREVFEHRREYAVPRERAQFAMDLYRGRADLMDTILLDQAGLEKCPHLAWQQRRQAWAGASDS